MVHGGIRALALLALNDVDLIGLGLGLVSALGLFGVLVGKHAHARDVDAVLDEILAEEAVLVDHVVGLNVGQEEEGDERRQEGDARADVENASLLQQGRDLGEARNNVREDVRADKRADLAARRSNRVQLSAGSSRAGSLGGEQAEVVAGADLTPGEDCKSARDPLWL